MNTRNGRADARREQYSRAYRLRVSTDELVISPFGRNEELTSGRSSRIPEHGDTWVYAITRNSRISSRWRAPLIGWGGGDSLKDYRGWNHRAQTNPVPLCA